MPVNYFQRYLGNNFKVAVPCKENGELILQQVADLLTDRLDRADRQFVVDGTARRESIMLKSASAAFC